MVSLHDHKEQNLSFEESKRRPMYTIRFAL